MLMNALRVESLARLDRQSTVWRFPSKWIAPVNTAALIRMHVSRTLADRCMFIGSVFRQK